MMPVETDSIPTIRTDLTELAEGDRIEEIDEHTFVLGDDVLIQVETFLMDFDAGREIGLLRIDCGSVQTCLMANGIDRDAKKIVSIDGHHQDESIQVVF